ncbi:uncharacterized protein LOC143017482 [Oratosquilla oratoria]|uniref:uncharacterized protein LOC143017482 n=1 Tax=Oratosquilla oratoria TaxID=337810 RepID=UPI003F769716
MDRESPSRPERRTALVARELARYRIDMVALTSINERLMKIRFPLDRSRHTTIMSAYAPTLTSSDEAKETFYEELNTLVKDISPSDKLFLLGDFSARVGANYNNWNGVLGLHSTGRMNSNGLMLLSMCAENHLAITNTMFRQADKYKTTWLHPRSRQWHLIDFVICHQRDIRDVKITRAMRGAECWTDHRLVRCILSMHIIPPHRKMPKTIKPAYNVARLKNSQQRNVFAGDLDNRLIAHGPLTGCPTQQWEQFNSLVTESARATIGPRKRIHQDWFDENNKTIKSLLDNKQKAFIEWQNDPSSTSKHDRFKHLQRQAQTTFRKMQDKAEEVKRYADIQNSKMFYSAIKEIYRPMKPCTAPLLTADGSTLLKDKRSINARWMEHFCNLLNRPSTAESHALDLVTQKPTVHSLDLQPTMEEVMKAIRQTNSGKAPSMDGIPAEIFNAADMIFAMRQGQEKCIEQNMDLYAVFIDLTRAFDTVNREALWVILSKLGCPDKFVNLIRQFIDDMTGQVLLGGEVSESFNISNGVKQGFVLAPILFNLFFTCVLNHAFRDLDLGVYLRFRSEGSVFDLRRLNAKTKNTEKLILEELFVDDCTFMAHKESDLQLIVDRFAEAARLFGLTHRQQRRQPGQRNQCQNLQSHPSTWPAQNTSLEPAKRQTSTKLKVYRAVVLTSLLYGCESWTLYRRYQKQLERFHMRSLRSILNIKWKHQVTNLEANRITTSLTKFSHACGLLPSDVLLQVSDTISKAPTSGTPYEDLKKAVLDRLESSEATRLQELLSKEELGNEKPSDLLRRMKRLLGDKYATFDTSILRHLFYQRLPTTIQGNLFSAKNKLSLDELATLADEFMASVPVARPTIANLADQSATQALTELVSKLTLQAPAIVGQKVNILSALKAFLHNTDIFVKALTLFFTEVSIILWKIVQTRPEEVHFH